MGIDCDSYMIMVVMLPFWDVFSGYATAVSYFGWCSSTWSTSQVNICNLFCIFVRRLVSLVPFEKIVELFATFNTHLGIVLLDAILRALAWDREEIDTHRINFNPVDRIHIRSAFPVLVFFKKTLVFNKKGGSPFRVVLPYHPCLLTGLLSAYCLKFQGDFACCFTIPFGCTLWFSFS